MGRFFNTSGPNKLEDHYTLDPLARLVGVRDSKDIPEGTFRAILKQAGLK